LVLGLCVTARPDAGIFVVVAGLAFVAVRRLRAALVYGVAAGGVVSTLLLWRWSYYGSVVPNTYYAKSAGTPWWSQGGHYLGLYLEQYALLLLPLVLLVVLALRRPETGRSWWAFHGAVAFSIVLYAAAVVRVGGDFMFGRLFVPLTPLLALLLERTSSALLPGRALVHLLIGGSVAASMQLLPRPVSAKEWRHGIADEWAFYDVKSTQRAERQAAALAAAVDELDVRVGFLGGMARVVDAARLPYATDVETGLTNAKLARVPLEERGRPGHEKRAHPLDMLELRLDVVIGNGAARTLGIQRSLPVIPIRVGEVDGVLIRWNPAVVDALRERGARIQDFPGELDEVIAKLPQLTDAQAKSVALRVQRFYFDWADDPAREAAFEARLRQIQD
jgi:hypothetical protein